MMLSGLKVMVTRPAHQAAGLCQLIESSGGEVIRFPTINIVENELSQETKNYIRILSEYDIGIFVSRNAVDHTMKILGDDLSVLSQLQLIAIGMATKKALDEYFADKQLSTDIIVNQGRNSESLLDENSLEEDNVKDKRIIIFRGKGGREILADTLKERGAELDYVEVYQREFPVYKESDITEIWQEQIPDVVVVTSQQGLQNLFTLLDESQQAILLGKQLVVMSHRILDVCNEYKFAKSPIVAEGNSDEGILKAIVKWAGEKEHHE